MIIKYYYTYQWNTNSSALDFNTDIIAITLGPSQAIFGDAVDVPAHIIDDEINESTESFVGVLELISAVDPSTVVIERNTTQLVIIDNDGECVYVTFMCE